MSMSCANCMSPVTSPSDRNSILKNVVSTLLHYENEQVTIVEALADMFGQHETFLNLLRDIDREEDIPFLCPSCFDVVSRNVHTRWEFVSKSHKDGLINSSLSLVKKDEEEREVFDKDDVKESYPVQKEFGLRDCKIVLTRCDEVKQEIKDEMDWEMELDGVDMEDLDLNVDSDLLEHPETCDTDFILLEHTESETQSLSYQEEPIVDDTDGTEGTGTVQTTNETRREHRRDEEVQETSSLITLRTHNNLSRVLVKFNCSQCNKTYPNASCFEDHKKIHCDGQEKDDSSGGVHFIVDNDGNQQTHNDSKKDLNKSQVEASHVETESSTRGLRLRQIYKCKKCHKTFVSASRLKNHANQHDKDKKVEKGELSDTLNPTDRKVTSDEIDSDVNEGLEDSDDSDSFYRGNALKRHKKRHTKKRLKQVSSQKKKVAKINCTEKTRNNKHEVRGLQIRQSIRKSYKCSKCDKVLLSNISLQMHMAQLHDKTERLICPVENCNKIFHHKRRLTRHMYSHSKVKRKHPPIESYRRDCDNTPIVCMKSDKSPTMQKLYCPECPMTFPFKAILLHHLNAVHLSCPTEFQCSNCTCYSKTLMRFVVHANTVVQEKLFQCVKCNFSTHGLLNYQRHFLNKHKRNVSEAQLFKLQQYTEDNTSVEFPATECQRLLMCRNAHCNFSCKTEEEWNAHEKCGKMFRCCSENCEFICDDQEILVHHIQELHGLSEGKPNENDDLDLPNQQYLCDWCGCIFMKPQALRWHKRHCQAKREEIQFEKVEGTRKYNCELCSEEFSFLAYLQSHKMVDHHHERDDVDCSVKFKCNHGKCTFQGTGKDDLTDHLFTHTRECPMKCTFTNCDYATGSMKSWNTHARMHTGSHVPVTVDADNDNVIESLNPIKPHQCEQCGKQFLNKFRLESHRIVIHSDKQTVDALKGKLKVIVKTANGSLTKFYKCNSCAKSFKNRSTGYTHVLQFHENDEKIRSDQSQEKFETLLPAEKSACEECSETFDWKANLLIHSWLLHTTTAVGDNNGNSTDLKKHKCGICSYSCTTMDRLRIHVCNAHTNEKFFRCKELNCGYESASYNCMVLHEKKSDHKSIRKSSNMYIQCKLQCSFCQKYFLRERLERHIANKHNGRERPFKCSQCSYTSAYNCSLKTHIKFKHGNEGNNSFQTYSCTLCTFSSVWKGAFVLHMKDLHGVQNFASSKRKRRKQQAREISEIDEDDEDGNRNDNETES